MLLKTPVAGPVALNFGWIFLGLSSILKSLFFGPPCILLMTMWQGMESTRFVLAITIIITASHKLQANQLVAAPYIFTVINVLFTAK